MTTKRLTDAFARWTPGGQPLVLASVYATKGSTYSKAGAQMLIRNDGVYQGMLSGGCLEGDLALRSSAVVESGLPQAITYDLGQDNEELWGLGVGCDGVMQVFLQRLCADSNYQPFAGVMAAYEGTDHQVLATVVGSNTADLVAGSSLLMRKKSVIWSNVVEKYQERVVKIADKVLGEGYSRTLVEDIDDGSCELLFKVIAPFPRVLVLGAGLDAEPVVRFVVEMGWRAVVSDHRPAYLDQGEFSAADRLLCVAAADLCGSLDLDQFDAAIVMSHHLVTDESYLRQLAASGVPYVGLLGPAQRKERLMKQLGNIATLLDRRLHGPAGIDINASGPASIALSIVAQLQQHFSTRPTISASLPVHR